MGCRSLLCFYHILILVESQLVPIERDAVAKLVACAYHDIIRCPLCTTDETALKFCIDCKVPVGPLCMVFHKTIKHFLEHRVIDITCGQKFEIMHFAPKRACSNHKHIQATSYCMNCSKFLCEECVDYHNKQNHMTDSLHDIHSLLELIHEFKRSLENDIRTNRNISDEAHAIFSTAIEWIDVVFGIRSDFINITSVPVPVIIRETVEEGKSSLQIIVMKSKILKEQLENVKTNFHLMNEQMESSDLESTSETGMHFTERLTTSNIFFSHLKRRSSSLHGVYLMKHVLLITVFFYL